MISIDLTRLVTAEDRASAAAAAHVAAVKAECSRRIYEVLDAPTVSNVQGAALAGELTEDEMAVFRAGRSWVDAMLNASRVMAVDLAAAYLDDASWPDMPAGVIDLAARF